MTGVNRRDRTAGTMDRMKTQKHSMSGTRKPAKTAAIKARVAETPEFEGMHVIERPDGYYWQCVKCARELGPFATRAEAEQHMDLFDEEALEVGESVQEAGAEIGISDWIDPDTGELAEEEVSRLEEH